MATVAGQATSYDLPNYIGELFQKSEKPNAMLRLLGGLTGGLRTVDTTEFAMGVDYVLPAASQPNILEGATPTAAEQDTGQSTNVVQIFQEAVDLTYSAQARTGAISGLAAIPGSKGNGNLQSPTSLEWQMSKKVEKVARDANYTFINGAYVKPANNATARKSRGLITAVTTNLFANGGTPRAISTTIIDAALQAMVVAGSFNIGDQVTLLMDAVQYGKVCALYEGAATARFTDTREVVGVGIRQVITKWAVLNLTYDPDVPAGKFLIFRPEMCRVVAMPIPNKGVLFSEQLAKVGSGEKWQLYGELGLDYRNEIFHGVIADLN